MTREEVEACTILRCVVGSTVHGTNNGDAVEDRDEMGICIEPIHEAMGVGAPFEQFVYRSAAEREGRHDAPSQAGDLDLTIYSLRKWMRLALKGNPTVLLPLFVPDDDKLIADSRGYQLRELAPHIVSKEAGKAFLGYLQAQRQRLLGERGNGGHGQPRRGLIEQYGFDTKFAMHMCRLGLQGVELLTTGQITLPIQDAERTWLLDLRNGKVSMQDALTKAGELEREIKDLLNTSPLPDKPNTTVVEAWMVKLYLRNWSARRTLQDQLEDKEVFHVRT